MSKPKLKWSNKGEDDDFAAAQKYLSLLTSDAKAKNLVRDLQGSPVVEYAAKDLLRAANLALLPRDEPHVEEDLERIDKGKSLPPVLLIRGDMGKGFPLIVADGYHRICAAVYFDESAPVACRMAANAPDKGAKGSA